MVLAMNKCSAVAIFCEDIRTEFGGKETLVGILPDNVRIRGIGQHIAKLALYVRVHMSLDFSIEELSIKLASPNGDIILDQPNDKQFLEKSMNEAHEKKSALVGVIMRAIVTPFIVNHEGQYTVSITINGEENICGFLNIIREDA